MVTVRTEGRSRLGGWILALSPLLFALVIVPLWVPIWSGTDARLLDEFTPEHLGTVAGFWIAYHLAWPLVFATGAFAVIRLAGAVEGERSRGLVRAVTVASVLSVLAGVALAAIRIPMLGHDGAVLADHALFGMTDLLSLSTVWFAILAVGLLGAALFVTGTLRRTGAVVAVVCLPYLLLDIVTWGGGPPFVLAFLWLAIGVAWLRRRVA